MISIDNTGMQNIGVESVWNDSEEKELLMHTIHVYPAKFPAFIATKAFEYAENEGVVVGRTADIFCGCGTVALEAKVHGKDFWGCDINPVATLIAKTKSTTYDLVLFNQYFESVKIRYKNVTTQNDVYSCANKRLQYWYTENSYVDLYRLKASIEQEVPEGEYRDAFLCIFSSILKTTSRWLTKSIKPQVDPDKEENNIWNVFERHSDKFIKAIDEIAKFENTEVDIQIQTCNFLETNNVPNVDLIVSSPPYVTSYEYADLHQLSTLWLQYAKDYKELRQGSIGSTYNSANYPIKHELLNEVGRRIIKNLEDGKVSNAKIRAVARYYIDMQNAVEKCAGMLNNGGMVFFVVGDTEYKGVQILNSEHLIQSMTIAGFHDIKATKRTISKKMLTPYRDAKGKFSSDKSNRTIYHEEYIITGRIWRY